MALEAAEFKHASDYHHRFLAVDAQNAIPHHIRAGVDTHYYTLIVETGSNILRHIPYNNYSRSIVSRIVEKLNASGPKSLR